MRCLPVLLAVTLAQTPAPSSPPATQRSITIRYSDGTFTPQLVRERGGMWTPKFPKRSDAAKVDGLALSALQVAHRLDGSSVIVDVSLIYGSPHQRTVPIATVRLKNDEP